MEITIKVPAPPTDAVIDEMVHQAEAHNCTLGGGGTEYTLAGEAVNIVNCCINMAFAGIRIIAAEVEL